VEVDMKKSKKKFVVLVFVFIFSVSFIWADIDDFPSALGFFSGSVVAQNYFGGLHYQHWFSDFGIQSEAGIMYSPAEKNLDYSVVFDILYSVYSYDYSDRVGGRLYVYGTLGHLGATTNYSVDYDNPVATAFRPSLLVGLGIGIEIVFFQHFSFPIHFGYAADIPLNTTVYDELLIGLTICGGVRYRF